MQVILLERVDKLGQMGDVVSVKDGFARNFLVPQGKALRATKSNLADFERRRVQLEAANLERKDEAQRLADKIEGRSVVIIRQAGEAGQLYGSVNPRDIAVAFTADGVTTSCMFTGDESHLEADSVVLVTARLPENRLFEN